MRISFLNFKEKYTNVTDKLRNKFKTLLRSILWFKFKPIVLLKFDLHFIDYICIFEDTLNTVYNVKH